MIYGYIRVSSDKQTVENQRFEINNFCEKNDMQIDGWIEETISGTKAETLQVSLFQAISTSSLFHRQSLRQTLSSTRTQVTQDSPKTV